MEKSKISKETGKLKWICNEAFFGVKKIFPKNLRESRMYDEALAFNLGMFSGFGVAKLGEILIQTVNDHGGNLSLESITSHSLSATVLVPVISYVIAPNYIMNFIKENPRYSSGVAGVMFGASIKAIDVLFY